MNQQSQQASVLLMVLVMMCIIVQTILTILILIQDDALSIDAWQLGQQDKNDMLIALKQLEKTPIACLKTTSKTNVWFIDPPSQADFCHLKYQNKSYDYVFERLAPHYYRLTLLQNPGRRMQSTLTDVPNLHRLSWQMV